LNAKAAVLALPWRDLDDRGFGFSTSGIITTEWKVEGIDASKFGPDRSLRPNAREEYAAGISEKRVVHLSKFKIEGKLLASSSTIAVTRRRE
jgi:hypothetical protein